MASNNPSNEIDPAKLAEAVVEASSQCHDTFQRFIENQGKAEAKELDPIGLGQAYLDFTTSLMRNPEKLLETQMQAWTAYG